MNHLFLARAILADALPPEGFHQRHSAHSAEGWVYLAILSALCAAAIVGLRTLSRRRAKISKAPLDPKEPANK